MATEAGTETGTETEFGRVNRTVGVVFKYGLLAATLVGIVSLAVLLVFVFFDAVQPQTADPGWYLAYAATLVLPSLGVGGGLYRRNPQNLTVGLTALGVPLAGVLLAAAIAVLFVDVVPVTVWLGYVAALAIGVAVIAAYRRWRPDAGAYERAVVGLGVLGYVLVGVPGYLKSVPEIVVDLPVVPTGWMVMLLTFGLPVAAATKLVVDIYHEGEYDGWVAGVVVLVAAAAGAFAGPLAGVGAIPGVLLPLGVLAPTGVYVDRVVRRRPRERPGLLLPVVVVGGVLLGTAAVDALGFVGPATWLDWQFLISAHSSTAAEAGVYPALVGSVLLMVLVAVLSFPVGVGAAVYLEEYAADSPYTRFVQVNISNLAGVPSVVYGLLGLGLFVNALGMGTGSLLVAGLTLGLLILPIVIISAQEAIRSVPDSLREASYGMGATRWQTIRNVVLPRAMPGILTGTILALGRAIGETAPLIMIGLPNVIRSVPTSLSDQTGALPMQVYAWATLYASPEFYETAVAAGVLAMVGLLLAMNATAIVLRNRYQSEA